MPDFATLDVSALANYGTPAATSPATVPSTFQSDSLFNLLGTLGTAYFGSEAIKATAGKTQGQQLNATGTPVSVPVNTSTTNTPAKQWIAGVDNKIVVIGGLVLFGGLLLLGASRR